jgi:ABC-type uncharacterized transport system permease subunit
MAGRALGRTIGRIRSANRRIHVPDRIRKEMIDVSQVVTNFSPVPTPGQSLPVV